MEHTDSSNEAGNGDFRVVWGRQRFHLSIGWKTLIAFALVVFIPMFGLMQITEHTLRTSMEQETVHSLEANLRGAWRVYYERINNVRSSLLQAATTPAVRRDLDARDDAELGAVLERLGALLPATDVWLAIDTESRVVARRNGPTGQVVRLNNMVARAFTLGEPVTSTELVPNALFLQENPLKFAGLETTALAQVSVVPVRREGEIIGALAGLILLNGDTWLPNAIHDYLSIDAALFGSIIQESRIISASERPNNIWATGLLAPTRLNESIRSGEIFRGRLTINDIPSFIISEPITNLEGTPVGALSIGVKSSNIEALIRRNARNIYLFIGLGIALSLVIAYLAYRDTMKPMRAIVGAMDHFADGHMEVRTDLRTKDEFEELGGGFNRMAAAVQEHRERVESFNALTSLLVTNLKPRELLQSVLNRVIELTRSQAGTIYLTEREDGRIWLQPYVGYAVDLGGMEPVRFGEALPGQAAREKRLIHAKHIRDDCQVIIDFGVARTLPREVMVLPILYRDEVLGVILLASINGYEDNELSLLEYMANQVAVVLENALAHEQLERLSRLDGLTGVFNRRYLNERIEEEFNKTLRYDTPASLLMLDLDHFKRINDEFGHQAGDTVLVETVDALRRHLRSSDLIGRYGGEEFLILLPNTGPTDAQVTAEKLRAAIAELRIAAIDNHSVTTSIGVAAFPLDRNDTLDAVVRRADAALYQAKERGRNRVVVAAKEPDGVD